MHRTPWDHDATEVKAEKDVAGRFAFALHALQWKCVLPMNKAKKVVDGRSAC